MNRLNDVALLIDSGDYEAALAELTALAARFDGDPSPPDLLEEGPEKTQIYGELQALIAYVQALLAG